MKKNFTKIILMNFTLLTGLSFAQQTGCATMDVLNKKISQNPTVLDRYLNAETKMQEWEQSHPGQTRAITTIPVVVHVVYNTTANNISDAQIQTQIDRLNLDFRLMNEDSLMPNHPYWQFTADTQIEFCLASQDPSGNPTTGITRTETDSTVFTMGYPFMKFDETGGKTGWDSEHYLNFWVAQLNDGWLGFATFPSDLAVDPELDGVVVRPEAFGSMGTAGSGAFTGNDMGRTATHEVGHWLFLRHIWGDNTPDCGDDLVTDTKGAFEPNFGIPTFPLKPNNGCGTGQNGEMFMNYMDYPDDAALVMFTAGQATRMNNAIDTYRSSLKNSFGCNVAGLTDKELNSKFSVFPNPSSGKFSIKFFNEDKNEIVVKNILGEDVKFFTLSNVNNSFDISDLSEGVYFVNLKLNGSVFETKKIILSK